MILDSSDHGNVIKTLAQYNFWTKIIVWKSSFSLGINFNYLIVFSIHWLDFRVRCMSKGFHIIWNEVFQEI